MVRIGFMAGQILRIDRRALMAGFGAASLGLLLPGSGAAQAGPPIAIRARRGALRLLAGGPDTPVWMLAVPELRFARGDNLQVEFANDLTVPVGLDWRGIDGVPAIELLVGRRLLAAAGWEKVRIPLRHAGTLLCDMSVLVNQDALPARGVPVVVAEGEPVSADRDEVLLVEEWRLRPDGMAAVPGTEAYETTVSYTLNGKRSLDVSARSNERLRLRFINGSRRTVIALKLEFVDVTVMAIDSQPAEPFPARNGALVLAPGSRVDAFVDVTAPPGSNLKILLHEGRQARTLGFIIVSRETPARAAPLPPPAPLPPNGLPARLDLKNALRADLALSGPEWTVIGKPCRLATAGLPRQGRAHRRAGPDQPCRGRNRLSSARPSLPPARQARRRLEAVLARHAGDRARPDPAHRLCGRACRTLADRIRRDRLGRTALRAMVCRGLKRFRAKACPDLIRGGHRFA